MPHRRCCLPLVVLPFLALAVGSAGLTAPAATDTAQQAGARPKLDKKKLAAMEALADEWFAARPPTAFGEWDAAVRDALTKKVQALGELPEGTLPELADALWKVAQKHAPKWKKEEIETPYGTVHWLQKGKGGRKSGFALGLHGGGEGQGNAGEAAGTWNPDDCLCMCPQGIRLVHDTWNTVHGEKFALTLIEYAKWRYDVDPDRVYTLGFSMGGTGSFFLAGRHPDLFAGAIPAHGVLMADPKSQLPTKEEVKSVQHGLLPNLRNLAMYWYTGSIDDHCRPGTYMFAWDRLMELKAQDPGGYGKLTFTVHPNLGHSFPPGEPAAGLKVILAERRNSFPDKLVWEYADDPFPQPTAEDPTKRFVKRWYYNVHCDAPVDHMRITVERKGNEFDVRTTGIDPAKLELLFNATLIDPAKNLVVRVNGKGVVDGSPIPDFWTVLETLDARMDRTLVFDRRVTL